MTKEVLIHLKGMQTTDETHGPDEPLELITTGEYYYRNDTHYPLLRGVIGSIMGDQVQLVNPAYETSLALKQLLIEQDLLNQGSVEEEFPYRFYVSDAAEKFKSFANSILPYDVEMTKQVNLEE